VLAGPRCKEGGSKSMCEGAEIPTPVSSTSGTFDVFSRSSKVPAHTVTGRQADVRWGSSLGWRGSVAGQCRDRCSPPSRGDTYRGRSRWGRSPFSCQQTR
jgi:hypothetical protein